MGPGGWAREGPGGLLGASESFGGRVVFWAEYRQGRPLQLPLQWPRVIHSQSGDALRGPLLAVTQDSAPSHPLCRLGKPRKRQLTWVAPRARGGFASPTFLPPRAPSSTTFWTSSQCVDLSGMGVGETLTSGAESSGKQLGEGRTAWVRGWPGSLGDPDSSPTITSCVTAGKLL